MVRILVKGDTDFGLSNDFQEVVLEEPDVETLLKTLMIKPEYRKYLLLIVNNKTVTPPIVLHQGDRIILHAPVCGG
jgi:hypothetical protein